MEESVAIGILLLLIFMVDDGHEDDDSSSSSSLQHMVRSEACVIIGNRKGAVTRRLNHWLISYTWREREKLKESY